MAAATPLVCLLFSTYELWARHPAYHFFPLPLAALGWMVLQTKNYAGLTPATAARRGLVWLSFLLALASFALVSPVLAGFAFVVSMSAYGLSIGGEGKGLFPWWSFPSIALFFIPPPLQVDVALHQLLAGLAAKLSQGWLDTMGIVHVVEGVIVATSEKRFFVDDACSGTNSLLVALCVAVVLASLKKRSPLHLATLLVCTALIAVASNVLRICVVISGLHFWKMPLDEGLPHDLLGLAFFVFDLFLVWSADHGIQFVLNRPILRLAPSDAAIRAPRMAPPLPIAYRTCSILSALVGAAILTGPFVLSLTRPQNHTTQATTNLDQFTFPKKLGDWVREGDKPLEDSVIGKLGVRNQVWLYRKNGLEAYVAVNFPFLGFHDTRVCYQGQGWQFQKELDQALPGDAGKTLRFLQMQQPLELVQADLWLCVLDEQGAPRPFSSENLVARMTDRLISRWKTEEPQTSTYVLQVLALDPATQDNAQQAYIELVKGARNDLAEAISNRNQSQGKESE